jgi:hypothetical protein
MYIHFIAAVLFSVVGSGRLETIKCDPLPTMKINDARITRVGNTWKVNRVIEGTASKDSEPLQFAKVELYSGEVPRHSVDDVFRHTMTDFQGYFLLENLPEGRYTLRFEGMGSFQIEVTARISQQAHYGFSSNRGCLSWGANKD